MRRLHPALWPSAFAFGVIAELAGRPPLPALDAATGFSMLALGLLAQRRQPRYAVGWILYAAGVAWFIGTLAGWAVFLHRAPLAQLILTYPARRLIPGSRGRAPRRRHGLCLRDRLPRRERQRRDDRICGRDRRAGSLAMPDRPICRAARARSGPDRSARVWIRAGRHRRPPDRRIGERTRLARALRGGRDARRGRVDRRPALGQLDRGAWSRRSSSTSASRSPPAHCETGSLAPSETRR